MEQSDRERFEALIAAKKNKGGGNQPSREGDGRGDRRSTPKAAKPFRRKV